ncbi:hypothetical protein HUN24_09610 [Acinetobacter baumannii]|uniref:hypothetical protein n=1 Tax=Acinetobacter baumannii TaxID=470 RepID=UPI00157FEB97|nr:hypothetical protein [Acinetobacter baumannii]NUF19334.1 hypothetical protein [Acinetobacter baumannii]
MAVVIQSNNVYTGNKALPNIIDSITQTSSKTQFLKKLYATINGDTAYITDANSDVLFDALKAHRTRVLADGGLIPSLANTLRALIFANQNSLTIANYSAFAADFGIKLVGNTVTKLYDIAGRDMKVNSGTFERATDAGFNVLKNTATSTLISESYIIGNQGMILGSSLHDADAGSSSSQAVKGMYMSDTANGSGTGVGYLESNQGGFSRLYYKRQVDNVMTSLSYDQVGNYKKYSGLVGYLSNSNNRVEIYENGVLKNGATAAQVDLSAVNIYPVISALSLNSFIRESWIIRSTSQNLAMLLSNYLNKSV